MSHSGHSDYHGSSSRASSIYSDSPASLHSSAFGSPNFITGQGEPSTPRDRRMPSQASPGPAIQFRHPQRGQRSFSYGTRDGTPTPTATNSVPRVLPVSSRRSTITLPPQARPWSLFEQLMENEEQVRSSLGVPPGPRRTHSDQPPRRSYGSAIVHSPIEAPPHDVFSAFPRPRSTQDVYPEQRTGTDEDGSSLQDSEETATDAATATTRGARTAVARARWFPPRVPTIPLLWKNMLKCSVAYFIGSLFTFHPWLSRFFGDLTSYGSGADGPYPSAHLIATM